MAEYKCGCVANCGKELKKRHLMNLPAAVKMGLQDGSIIFIFKSCTSTAPEGWKKSVGYSFGTTWKRIK
ncbi:hypothetical protein COT87_01770 [Candidatus Collierbacteria bacterium CG10_big_fil_rev_8_21_14_0_10_44_9]|uniref:Uncharacterized protein n=1 Tax=Candidatus Collierbacteria bacterium CG10_big_fil_rev_8_21_14_0_10_44_9 TaxID=1974535 RepID=A0A2H0VIV0_9BACT|nr:MAG: hypothetical protein COT87_01770 [Candidatus Collierbacteria bacterium CG10_big_fil_rev_8_21_14_0_10_44_9]